MFKTFSLSLLAAVVLVFSSSVPNVAKAEVSKCMRVLDQLDPNDIFDIIADKCKILGISVCPNKAKNKVYSIINQKKNNPPADCNSLPEEQQDIISEVWEEIMQ